MLVCAAKLSFQKPLVKALKVEDCRQMDCQALGLLKLAPYRRRLVLLLAVATTCGVAAWRRPNPSAAGWLGPQVAAAPLPMPDSGGIDHRFDPSSPWLTARIPRACRFDPPLGSEHGGLVYNAQKFWEMNEKRGGCHFGDDLNGIGGMNTDLGDPVFATADGLVLYSGEHSPGWGKLIVIAHVTADARTLHSMYAHLDRIDVVPGDLVPRGARIGTVGTANGYYPAHLHFEIRASDGVDVGAGYALNPLNRLDPLATVSLLRNAAADELGTSPLAQVLNESRVSASP